MLAMLVMPIVGIMGKWLSILIDVTFLISVI